MSDLTDAGILAVINDQIGRYQYIESVQATIDSGLAKDTDPTWEYADIGARRRAGLTPEGEARALELGWVCTCGEGKPNPLHPLRRPEGWRRLLLDVRGFGAAVRA